MTIQPTPPRWDDLDERWMQPGARDLDTTHLLRCLDTIEDNVAQVRMALRSRALEMQFCAEQHRIDEPPLQPGSTPLQQPAGT